MTTLTSLSEIFVPVQGWEDTHQVSNKGRVLSKGKPLKPFMNNGYWCINLKSKGVAKLATVHRLVGTHFLPHTGENRHLCICHKNDIRTNCSVEYLFVGTRGDNIKDAWNNGLFDHRRHGNRFTVSLDF
jgi:hypothetical protein